MSNPQLSYWKRLWRLISSDSIDISDISDLIDTKVIREQFQHGLCYFKPFSSTSFTNLKSQHSEVTKIIPIVEKIQKLVNLDSFQTRDLILHFLCNEFHGTEEDALNNFTYVESKLSQLVIDIWLFYNSERSFMLNVLKLLIEYKDDEHHPYHIQFSKVIKNIGVQKLMNSQIKQFEYLLNDNPPTKKSNGDAATPVIKKQWAERNLREQLSILQIVLLLLEEEPASNADFNFFFTMFKKHSFGRQQSFMDLLEERHRGVVTKIIYSEVMVMVKMLDPTDISNVSCWIESSKEAVERELVRLQHNEEHGPLLLAWMLLTLESKDHADLFSSRYQQFGEKAMKLQVFSCFYAIVTNTIFADKCKCASIVRRRVFSMLCTMCDKFDADGSVTQAAHAVQLCAELLSRPDIADHFWKMYRQDEMCGVVCMWNTALEYFPYDFKIISELAAGLSKAGKKSSDKLLDELESLPVFTELFRPNLVQIRQVPGEENEVTVLSDYHPLCNSSYIVRAGCSATILDRQHRFIHYRSPVSYWTVLLADINRVLDERLYYVELLDRIGDGIAVLKEVLEVNGGAGVPPQLVSVSEAACDVLLRFTRAESPPLPLMVSCLEICTALVPSFTHQIYTRLMNTGLLPTVGKHDLTFVDYAVGASFDSATVGLYLINLEQPSGEYRFLTAYIRMLIAFHSVSKCSDKMNMDVLLPGLILVLREVFPNIANWKFRSREERIRLTQASVTLVLRVLQTASIPFAVPAAITVPTLLQNTCVYALLHVENAVELLRNITLGDPYLQSMMEDETNWICGAGVSDIATVQMSMSVLMQVLVLRPRVSPEGLSPLQARLYAPGHKVIPTVTGYMNHVFNKQLAHLACRLLKRFAMESEMSLLACLDMSAAQVRVMFLERLRDPHESASLKAAILELVSAAVHCQPGLTEAFFSQRLLPSPHNERRQEGVLSYMAQYLSAVKTNSMSLYNPLLGRIMGLFHALWKNNMQVLVNDLRENPQFWAHMAGPLFKEILPDVKAYSQIFNILGIELFISQGKVEPSLNDALERFFNTEEKFLDTWIAHIFAFQGRDASSEPLDEVPGWLGLLTSWKDFITIITKHLPFSLNITQKTKMVAMCLNALLRELETASDGRTVVLLAELYVIMLSNWKEDCFENKNFNVKQIDDLLNYTSVVYESLHPRAKRSILALSTVVINTLDYEIKANELSAQSIIRSVTSINSLELDKYSDTLRPQLHRIETEDQLKDGAQPVVLALAMLEQCLNMYDDVFAGLVQWLQSTRFINKLICCLRGGLHSRAHLNASLAAFQCLTAFARGPLSSDLLHCDLDQFLWLQLMPPKQMLNNLNEKDMPTDGNVWKVKDWMKLYGHGLDFVAVMINKHGQFFVGDALTFVGVHEEFLSEAILLPRQNLELDVLKLSASALTLVTQLLKYEARWRREHLHSLQSLMQSISVCFSHCVTLSMRARTVQQLVDAADSPQPAHFAPPPSPSPKVTLILNKLLQLIDMAAQCLLAFSPPLLSLLADVRPELAGWQPLVELQFGAPKLSAEPLPPLTFGTLLSAVCLLTRSLNHTYHCEEGTPTSSRSPRSRTPSRRRACSCSSPGEVPPTSATPTSRRLARSDSNTSLSSTASLATGWLAAFHRRSLTTTLEAVLTLLASQALLTLRDCSITERDKQLVRRELCTELTLFHDFVRKRIIDYAHTKNSLVREKLGITPLKSNEDEIKQLAEIRDETKDNKEFDDDDAPPPPPPKRTAHNSMRISVVRKQHLYKARTVTPEKKVPYAESLSPILPLSEPAERRSSGSATVKSAAVTSTPAACDSQKGKKDTSRISKRVSWAETREEDEEEEEIMLPVEEPGFSTLTEIRLADEDYFHFMSNVFLYICQTDL